VAKKTKKDEQCDEELEALDATAQSPIYRLPPWHVEATFSAKDLGQTVDWGVVQNKVPEQWTKTKGKGVTVGVVDTGCELEHPDLAGAIVRDADFTGSRSGSSDLAGHGTHCCGIIGARDNDQGVVGVAPECSIVVAKGLGDDGSGSSEGLIRALEFCGKNNCDVVSASWGSPYPDRNILAAIKALNSAGIFVIVAAGNDGRPNSVNYPAKWKDCISVAAVQRNGQVARFSSQGPEVDIAAPGQDILSTYLLSQGGYAKLSGTSMATPFVAGTVALCIAVHRKLKKPKTPLKTVEDLRNELKRTATDAGPQGHDPAYGWGLINPESLLTVEDLGGGPTTPPPPTPGELTIGNLTVNGIPGVLIFKPNA
jgi:subtilisin